MFLIVALAFAAPLLSAGVVVSADPNQAVSEPRGVTTPVIRSIAVEIVDIFDGHRLAWFHKAVNQIKPSTEEGIVRQELLFKEGDPYDDFLIQESERNLRSLRFVRNVTVISIMDGDFVDIVVTVQDTWTLFPQLSFSSGGGASRKSVALAEKNLFGYGKRLEMLYGDDEGRETWEWLWKDPRILGTKQETKIFHFDRSDGTGTMVSLARPFRNFVDPTAWLVEGEYFNVVGRMFRDGTESFIYRQMRRMVRANFSVALGNPEKLLNRFTFGFEHVYDHFNPPDTDDYRQTNIDPMRAPFDGDSLAADRRFTGPTVAWQRVEPDFISLNYIDAFGRVDDYNLGNDFMIKNHFALRTIDSQEDTWLVSIADSEGKRLGARSFMRGQFGGASRLDRWGATNTNLNLSLRYYNVIGWIDLFGASVGKHTLAGSLRGDWGDRVDKDTQYLLGAVGGLRGYTDRTFTGSSRVVFNAEDRFHLVEDFFKVIDIGGAFFFDAGGASERSFGTVFADDLHADIGVGLRLGFPRASGGGILRIDLAFPLRNGPDGSAQFEPRLLITTGQLFSARFVGESEQPGVNLAFSP